MLPVFDPRAFDPRALYAPGSGAAAVSPFRAKRLALAAVLLEGVGEGWTVYPSPPATIVVPAVVIGPRQPYAEPNRFGKQALHLRATVLLHVAGDTLDAIDDALAPIRAAVDADTSSGLEIQWERVGAVGIVTNEAGVDHVAATIDLTII